MWYRLLIAVVAALVAFANSWFGAHLSAADVTAFVLTAVGLILAEAHVERGKVVAHASRLDSQQVGNLMALLTKILDELGHRVSGGGTGGNAAGNPTGTGN